MITAMRENLKTGSKVILLMLAGALLVGLIPGAFDKISSAGIWAVRVNGHDISYKEYKAEVENQKYRVQAFKQQYGEYADWIMSMMDMGNPQSLARDAVARVELVSQFSDSIGIQVGHDYIVQSLANPTLVNENLSSIIDPRLIDPQTGSIDSVMLNKFVQYRGITIDIFEKQLEKALAYKTTIDVIASGFYLPRFDIKQKYQSDFAKKSFSIFIINGDKVTSNLKKEVVSNGDLESFYTQQNNTVKRYQVPEKRSGKMWTFAPSSYNIEISDSQIEAYYDANKIKLYIDKPTEVTIRRILFVVPEGVSRFDVQRKAAQIKDDIIQDPSAFASIAQKNSDDMETRAKGGLMDPFARGTHEAVFERAAFLLSQDGALSDVIETEQGFEILQRVAKNKQTFKALSAVKASIKKELTAQVFKKQFSSDIKTVLQSDSGTTSDTSLLSLIREKGGKAENIDSIALSEDPIASNIFKLKEGDVTFFIEDDRGVALKLTSIALPYTPSLESIKDKVLTDYRASKAEDALKSTLARAEESLKATTFKELQKSFEGEFLQTGWIEPNKQESVESLEKKGIPTAKMLQLENNGMIMTHQESGKGYLIRLDEIKPFNDTEFAEKRAEVAKTLESERRRQYQEGWVASLYRNATIDTNEKIISLPIN